MSAAETASWGIGGPYFDLAGNGTLVAALAIPAVYWWGVFGHDRRIPRLRLGTLLPLGNADMMGPSRLSGFAYGLGFFALPNAFIISAILFDPREKEAGGRLGKAEWIASAKHALERWSIRSCRSFQTSWVRSAPPPVDS